MGSEPGRGGGGPGSRVGSRVGSRAGTPVGGRERDRRERDKEREREVARERERDRELPSARVKGSSGAATTGSGVSRMKDPEREGEKERDQQMPPQFREREREQHIRDQHQQHNREQREHQPRDEEQPLNGPRSWWTSGPSPPGGVAPPVPVAPRVPTGLVEGYPPGPYDRIEGCAPGPGAPYPIGMEYNGHPGEVYFETGMRAEVVVVPGEWGVWEEEEEEEDYDEVGEKRRARVRVHLGTFVYPRLPFPYFFDIDVGGGGGEKEAEGGGGGDIGGEKAEEKGKVKEENPTNSKKGKETGMDVDTDSTPNPTLAVSAPTEGSQPSTEVQAEKMAKDKEMEDDEEKFKQKKEQEQAEPLLSSTQEQKIPVNPGENASSSHGQQPQATSTFKVDTETHVTIIIPNGHIPLDKPLRPRIWGGGVFPRMRMPRRMIMSDGLHHIGSVQLEGMKEPSGMADGGEREQPPLQPQRQEKRRRPRYRRVYTDDSDAFLCALHSGWVTWSGAAQARMEGKAMKIEVRVLRCIGAEGIGIGRFYGREEIVGRFLGGWGEKCFVPRGGLGEGTDVGPPGERRGDEDVDMQSPEGELDDEENDGRGLVSAGWGTGHDGSAIEIVDARFVEVSPVLRHLARFKEFSLFLRHV